MLGYAGDATGTYLQSANGEGFNAYATALSSGIELTTDQVVRGKCMHCSVKYRCTRLWKPAAVLLHMHCTRK